ncbi:NAD(P)/FAD-dependent oxidoreductase [Temperatibacter marinus]|uniref:NAD(P)/FAD-dependent oxidoreductase n=1 Tax=Temperatibacter marinus TaxID=1456591 RepID=A0AA52EKD4_9PROT|nr:NAD(P)/FAD-dependent oxidoreductase [Temperatibacter marinus]WND04099.1 NAD(P)/FAD-dependent oxidoreductase [Temperatibacter marinus]
MTNIQEPYDAIFIGSGIGSLTTAAILAKLYKKRCLILERHYEIGGFTHTFRRPGGNEWDVGVHYIGDMNDGATMRQISDFITDGHLKWQRMEDPFDVFDYPDFSFGQVGDKKQFVSDLIKQFPHEETGIHAYFAALKAARKWNYGRMLKEVLPSPMKFLARLMMRSHNKVALATVDDIIDPLISDPKLKAVLLSQWGDYGLAPSEAAFGTHALVANHYLHGGYYPEGGAASMADTIMPLIEAAGGTCLINHEVKEIIVESGKAVGVEVLAKKGKKGGTLKRFNAPQIVSCAGAHLTYDKLLPKEYGAEHAKALEPLIADMSTATMYIAFNDNPAKLGFRGENHWIFSSYDHNNYAKGTGLTEGMAKGGYLSVPSLKDPRSQTHRAELIGFMDWAAVEKWQGSEWMNRGTDYEKLKEQIAESLLNLAEERFPGFKDMVSYYDLSTPLSTQHFVGSPKGSIYGVKATPERYQQKCLGVKTPVKNLYLTGADAFAFGVGGAMISGVATAGVMAGSFGFFKVWKKITG